MKSSTTKIDIKPKQTRNIEKQRENETMSDLVQKENQRENQNIDGYESVYDPVDEEPIHEPSTNSKRDLVQAKEPQKIEKSPQIIFSDNKVANLHVNKEERVQQETLQQKKQTFYNLQPMLAIVGKIVCLLLIVAAVMVMMYFQRCAIFDTGCQIPLSNQANQANQTNLIVNRKFVPNSCFVINYTKFTQITTSGNTSHQRSNLTNYYCVKNVTQDGTLQMVGYQKRISEESLSQNSSEVLQVKYFDTEIGLQAALIGASAGPSSANSSDSQNETKSSITQQLGSYNISINQSQLQKALTNLVMFRFTILRNGTFDRIQFDRRNNNATIGDLPKLIKMFFPKLSMELYTTSTTRLLIEDPSANSTNSTFGNQTNSTTDSNSSSVDNQTNPQNDQNSQYSYKQSESGGTQLINEEVQEPTNDGGLYSSQKKSTQSNFDGGSNLNSSKLSGSAEVSSPTTDPSEAASTYNLTLAMSVKENVEMILVCTMLNITQDIVLSFDAYFQAQVVEEGYSLKFNQIELALYMSTPESSQNPSRLLMELREGQSKLFEVTKKVPLLKTSVVGLPLVIAGQSSIFLGITKLQQYKFRPRFYTQVGLRFSLSNYDYYKAIFVKEHLFEPLNLGFTLSKVVGYIQKYSGGFLDKLSGITKLGSLATFTDKLGPTIKTIITGVTKGLSEIDAVRQLVLPITQVDSLTSNIISFYNTYEDYFNNLTNLNSNKIISLISALSNYTNISLADSLAEFKQVQSQFLSYNLTGTQALQDLIASSTPILTQASAKIGSFLNSELNSLYNTEINKAKPFFDFYQYVNSTSKDMIDNLTAQVEIFQSGFNKTLVTFLDDFYLQPLRNFDTIKSFSEQIRQKINNDIASINASMNSCLSAANQYLQSQIDKIYSLYSVMSKASMVQLKSDYDTLMTSLNYSASNLNLSQRPACITNYDWWVTISCNCANTVEGCGQRFWENQKIIFPEAWKDAFNNMTVLSETVQGLKAVIDPFAGIASKIVNVTQRIINQSIYNPNIIKKFAKILSLTDQISTISTSDVIEANNTLQNFKAQLEGNKSLFNTNSFHSVCYYMACSDRVCCQKDILETTLPYFDPMINEISSFTATYMQPLLNIVSAVKNYANLINQFSQDNYNSSVELITAGTKALNYQKQSNDIIDKFTNMITNIGSFKNNVAHNYKLGLEVKTLISSTIQEFQTYANDFCSLNETKKQLIDQIKTYYKDAANSLKGYVGDGMLKTAFNSLQSNLLNLSSKAFSVIDPLNLCTGTINVTISDLTAFINETVNFDVIQKIAQPFWTQINITVDFFKILLINQTEHYHNEYALQQNHVIPAFEKY